MEITAPDTEALTALVGSVVVVSFSTGAVIGAGGLTKLVAVNGDRIVLKTKGQEREASISLIEKVATVKLAPVSKGRVFDVDLKAAS